MTEPITYLRLTSDDPLAVKIREKMARHKERGEAYPCRSVQRFSDVPCVILGRVPYHAETLERLKSVTPGVKRAVTLPDGFIITGDERLPRETTDQYEKYLIYRDLGPGRSLNRAAMAAGRHSYTQKNGHSSPVALDSHLSRMAYKWRWTERAAAYDQKIEIEARVAYEEKRKRQIDNHIARRDTYLENEYGVIEQGIKRIREMQAFPVDEQRIVVELYPDGREKTVTIIMPVKWNLASLSSYIGELQKIARLHFGMATSNSSAKIETTITDATNRDRQEITEAERAAHEFAAAKAEAAYFDALEEFKQRQEPERVTAQIAQSAESPAAD